MIIFSHLKQLKYFSAISRELTSVPDFLKNFSRGKYKPVKFFEKCDEAIKKLLDIPDAIGYSIKTKGKKTIVDAIQTNGGMCRKIYDGDVLIKKTEIKDSVIKKTSYMLKQDIGLETSEFKTIDLKTGQKISDGILTEMKPHGIAQETEIFTNGNQRIIDTIDNEKRITNIIKDANGKQISFQYTLSRKPTAERFYPMKI
ncbi:hypothetical protein J6Q66_01090 [bacterium]|nr:hypothetical protein [bacterium]